MARRGAGPRLIWLRCQEREHRLAFAAEIDERFAAPQGRAGDLQEVVNEFHLRHVRLAVGLFLGPACAGHKEEIGVGPDRLGIGGGLPDAGDGGALGRLGQGGGDRFQRSGAPSPTQAGWLPGSTRRNHGRCVRLSKASIRCR